MEVVSVKVDKDVREKMRRLPHINWSETVRRAIAATIEAEELKDRNVDPKDIREGLRIAESVRRTSRRWDSTTEIRKWRDQRK